MDTLVHFIIFVASIAITWFFAGTVIDAVGRIARRFCKTGFFTAFFLLGTLTSISEISVAINSGLEHVPQVSVGNLIGASVVLLLGIVPLLAAFGSTIKVNSFVSKNGLIIILATILLPVLLIIDGTVTKTEGLLALLSYGAVAYALYHHRKPIRACDIHEEQEKSSAWALCKDVAKVVVGAVAIFGAAHFLVGEVVYFAEVLSVPASLVGLLLLSIGTNVPEIVIAVRSVLRKRTDIALGDYLGSASVNTLIFAILGITTGTFMIEASEFVATAVLFTVGLVFFYYFARSRNTLTKKEGKILLAFYVVFVLVQLVNVLRFNAG